MATIAVPDKNKNKIPDEEQQEEDGIIPVLIVFKNKAMIKNIVVVLNDNSHTVIVGRHPDCNIVLTHPSISRYHLLIRFTPSSRTLSLLDLSSVHGTWVGGKKVEPGVSVDLKEGDTFTLGVSTRLYRLRWVPSVSQLDLLVPQQLLEVVKDVRSDENVERECGSFCCDEERKGQSKDESFGGDLNGSFGAESETSYCTANSDGCQSRFLSPPYVQSVDEVDNTQSIEACSEVKMPGETNLLCTLSEYFTHNICLPVVEAVQGTNMQQFQGLPDTFSAQQLPSVEKHWFGSPTAIDPASFDAAAMAMIPKGSEFGCTFRDSDKIEDSVFNSENTCEDIPDSKFHQIKVVEEVSMDSLSDGEKQDKCCQEYESQLHNLNAKSFQEQGYSMDEIVEDIGKKCIEDMDLASFDENGVAVVTAIPKDHEFVCTLRDNDRTDNIFTSGARIFNCDNTSLLVEEAIPVTKFQQIKSVEEVAVDSISDGEKRNKCDKELNSKLQAYLNAKSCDEEGNSLDKIVENTGKSFQVEPLISSVPREADLKIANKKENQTPQSLVAVVGFDVEILENRVEATEKAKSCHDQGHSLGEIVQVQDIGNKCKGGICPISPQVESVNISVPQEPVLNITNKIENQTPQSLIAVTGCFEVKILESSIEEETKKSSTIGNIWSSGKAASAPQDRTRKSRFMNTSNVDTKVEMSILKDTTNKSMPNKGNSSPKTFMRKKGKLEESKHSKSQRSHNLMANFSPNIIYPAESTSAISNKENQTPKVAQEWKSRRKPLERDINSAYEQDIMELKKKRVERVPLQSLMNPGGNRKSGNSGPVSAAKTMDGAIVSNCRQISDKRTKPSHISGEQKRSWDMIVDTASLLNKESRKALQLLKGLKGTRLIIPRLVIRELGSMKQQVRIFRRTSEAALALEWIEECMENTKWWIQIQSSITPPASPQNLEDHILDCALQYRSKENVGQIVLLSEDVTLKIKSMAKGLLCETVQQFHQSLVNPFSERFMWVESSPRGLTWSCHDDVVLREKYCGLPSKAGLKLITQQFLYLHV